MRVEFFQRSLINFVVVFNEYSRYFQAYDLLGDVREPLRIRGGEQAYLKGLTEATVTSFAEFEKLRQRAWAKRATASTAFNRQSSRSHAVVRLMYV